MVFVFDVYFAPDGLKVRRVVLEVLSDRWWLLGGWLKVGWRMVGSRLASPLQSGFGKGPPRYRSYMSPRQTVAGRPRDARTQSRPGQLVAELGANTPHPFDTPSIAPGAAQERPETSGSTQESPGACLGAFVSKSLTNLFFVFRKHKILNIFFVISKHKNLTIFVPYFFGIVKTQISHICFRILKPQNSLFFVSARKKAALNAMRRGTVFPTRGERFTNLLCPKKHPKIGSDKTTPC